MSSNLIMELNATIELFLHQLAIATITETQKCCDFLQSNGLLMPTTGTDAGCSDSYLDNFPPTLNILPCSRYCSLLPSIYWPFFFYLLETHPTQPLTFSLPSRNKLFPHVIPKTQAQLILVPARV